MPDPINIVITGTDKTGRAFGSVSQGLAGIGKSAQGTLAKGLKVAALGIAGLGAAGTAAAAGIGAAITKMTLDAAEVEGVARTSRAWPSPSALRPSPPCSPCARRRAAWWPTPI